MAPEYSRRALRVSNDPRRAAAEKTQRLRCRLKSLGRLTVSAALVTRRHVFVAPLASRTTQYVPLLRQARGVFHRQRHGTARSALRCSPRLAPGALWAAGFEPVPPRWHGFVV